MSNVVGMTLYFIFLVIAITKAACHVRYGGSYKFSARLEMFDNTSKPVGYQLTAIADIQQVNQHLLLVKFEGLKLRYATQTLPDVSYKDIKSLDSMNSSPFLIEIQNGLVNKIYVASNEEPSIESIKKGFASLFQFQIKTTRIKEIDISGTCDVNYEVFHNLHISKVKNNCQSIKKGLWGGNISSQRKSEIELEAGNKLLSVVNNELHIIRPTFTEFDIDVQTRMELTYEKDYASSKSYENLGTKEVISNVEKELGIKYAEHDFNLGEVLQNSGSSKFSDIVKENINDLSDKHFGTKLSAKAALNVIYAAKEASYDDIYKTLKSKSNKKIIGQLLDILGAVQTKESYKAAKQYLNLTSENPDLDLSERYLWSLSISPFYERSIIRDLLKLSKGVYSDFKLLETIVQTISSMVKKYFEVTGDNELLDETIKQFTEKLRECKKDDELCQRIYLKSFKNIASPKLLNIILEYALNGSPRTGMRAMKALKVLNRKSWNEEVIRVAERILFTNGTYESTSKTMALDILLESKPSNFRLAKVLGILKKREISKELKEYLLQRIAQISQKCELFQKQVKSVLSSEGLNNYNLLSQGGLSTAFERKFMQNGYLSTTQEVMSGILKQGYVHINLIDNETIHTVFTLGLFSNGLSSFVSTGDSSEDSGDSDELNAGLELTVLGVEFRPFIFFEGNGELMGHVFSGTASTLTPAYQAVLLLEDNIVKIPLASGQNLEVNFASVASVDLSGKIEISLWSRTAESLVQNRAGILKRAGVRVNSPLVMIEVEHDITVEPQISLTSYTEFYDQMALCLQLEQPESTIEYLSVKEEKIPGTKQRIRNSKVLKKNIPGKSYVLNAKNNEMCNIIYPSSEK